MLYICFRLCSDTVGRSGMFCAIATAIDCCKTASLVDVFQVVKAQRLQKPGLVTSVVSLIPILVVNDAFTSTLALGHKCSMLYQLMISNVHILYYVLYTTTIIQHQSQSMKA